MKEALLGKLRVDEEGEPNDGNGLGFDTESLCAAFQSLLLDDRDLESRIKDIHLRVKDDNAPIHISCHHIRLNGNQLPRTTDLATFLAAKVVDYCIPRSEWDRTLKEAIEKKTHAPLSKLEKKAKGLFSDLANSGEGGEMLLYLLQNHVLEAPQLLCKMPLKTNSRMHYHGVDGVHGKVTESGVLELYWGESKLYADLNDGIAKCLASIEPYLLCAAGGNAADRDLELLRDNIDFGVGQEMLQNAILRYLDSDDEMSNFLEIKGACLIGFNCKNYPILPSSKDEAQLRSEISDLFDSWKDTFSSKHGTFPKIAGFSLEVFFVPFDSVSNFRQAFFGGLGIAVTDNETE